MTSEPRTKQPLGERFEKALQFTASLHREQFRKMTNIPYVSHLLRVAGLALELGADEDTTIAALLHDAVEDQGGMGTAAIIRDQFGHKVADIVLECSDSTTPRNEQKHDWRERKEKYVEQLKIATPEARLVSFCDKLDNLTCTWRNYRKMGDDCFKCFATGKEGQRWFYSELIKIYKEHQIQNWQELEELWEKMFATE
ncbi:MAG: HD domain-containing protein [Thermoguttaceae bacterium]|nr:HD domain-containing protein [Thermoguttaceae bacterium]